MTDILIEEKSITDLNNKINKYIEKGYTALSEIFMSDHDYSSKTFCIIMRKDNNETT